MPTPSELPERFLVDRLPGISEQIRHIVDRAKALGIGDSVLDVLEAVVARLETMPIEWGDPEYATKLAGGIVSHAILSPFFIQYVTFEKQRIVCILKIRVLP